MVHFGLLLTKISVGALVGFLVGLTGVGGGVVLLPILIFGFGVSPLVAVGSDAAFNAFTKVGAGILHWRQGTVHWRLVGYLSAGSIPGALAGVSLLGYLRSIYGAALGPMLRDFLGILLILIPIGLLFQSRIEKLVTLRSADAPVPFQRVFAIGLFSGFLVGISSVGSGSVVLALLLFFVHLSPATLVGTDIVHAVALTGAAALFHLRLGTVRASLVFPLLIGSIPGSIVGVRLANVVPGKWLRTLLCLVLVCTGARLLWV